MNRVLYGEPIAQRLLEKSAEIINKVSSEKAPLLTIIQVGSLARSNTYVKSKKLACEKLGIVHNHIHLDESVTKEDIIKTIVENQMESDGIFIQLPLPNHLEPFRQEIIDHIDPDKDVDCLTTVAIGKMFSQQTIEDDLLLPATARGVIEMLDYYNINVTGKQVGIIGRSNLVGKPLIPLLLQKNATVISMNSHTEKIAEISSQCDVLIVAIGNPYYVNKDFLNPNTVVIDVGINAVKLEERIRIVGDLNPLSLFSTNSYSPVPKGVGVTTVASLMYNVAVAYKKAATMA